MIKKYEIDSWPRSTWYQTKGTREKFTCEDLSTGKRYYFKESLNKQETETTRARWYPTEFWSEIIASKVGQLLGFHMLDYNIAYSMGNIGCICEDMLLPRQTLFEGFPFLTAIERSFLPESNNSSKKLYDFQLIERALDAYGLERFLPNLVEVLVFDAIVGNSDRHQENWGFIFQVDQIQRQFSLDKAARIEQAAVKPIPAQPQLESTFGFNEENKVFKALADGFRKLLKPSIKPIQAPTLVESPADPPVTFFSPIFDSGSSLGRELTEESVVQHLQNRMQFDAYIRRGKAEVHWNNSKVAHEALLLNLEASYGECIRKRLSGVLNVYDAASIRALLKSTENFIPPGSEFDPFRLTQSRQEFMFRIIDTRLQSLFHAFSLTS